MNENNDTNNTNPVPTRQEMFDRAVRGLRGQGFRKAKDGIICLYATPDGLRCAWGWVDRDLTYANIGTVLDLRIEHTGLAARLSFEDAQWARELQQAHDDESSDEPVDVERRLRVFGEKHGLVWPEGHWPDCAANHGGAACDMGPECGSEDGAS